MAKGMLTRSYLTAVIYVVAVILITAGLVSVFFTEFLTISWLAVVVGVLLLPVHYILKKRKI